MTPRLYGGRSGPAAALAQHQLCAFRPLEIDEQLLRSLIAITKPSRSHQNAVLAAMSLTSNSGTNFAQPVIGGLPQSPVGIWPCNAIEGTSIEVMPKPPAERCGITERAVSRGVSA